MKHRSALLMLFFAVVCSFMALCQLSPPFSLFWLTHFIRPVSSVLVSVSARIPFPLAELLAAILLLWAGVQAILFLSGILRRRFSARPLLRLPKAAVCLMGVYALLWYPAYWAMPSVERASSAQLQSLCTTLIHRLNDMPLRFGNIDSVLKSTHDAVERYTNRPLPYPKFARYPEWMNALSVSGIYVPWTGEIIVHPDLPPAAMLFTSVHELMHLHGIADEGLANIAAWNACQAAGGEAANAADLWALRYAMIRLHEYNSEQWQACVRQMDNTLFNALESIGGISSAHPENPPALLLRIFGIEKATSDYDALTDWLLQTRFSAAPVTPESIFVGKLPFSKY